MNSTERINNSINRSFNGPIPPQFITIKFSASHPDQMVIDVDAGTRSFALKECLARQLFSVVDDQFKPTVLPDLVFIAYDSKDTKWVLNVPFRETLLKLIDNSSISRALYGAEPKHGKPIKIEVYDPSTPRETLLTTLYRDEISNNGDEPLYSTWVFSRFHARCDEFMAFVHEMHMFADYDFIDDQYDEDFMTFVHDVSRMGVARP